MNSLKKINTYIDNYIFYILSSTISIVLILSYIYHYYKIHSINLILILVNIITIILIYLAEYLYQRYRRQIYSFIKYLLFCTATVFISFYGMHSIYLILILILNVYIIIYEEKKFLQITFFFISIITLYINYVISHNNPINDLIYLTIYLSIFYILYYYKTDYLKRVNYLKSITLKNRKSIEKERSENHSIHKLKNIVTSNIEDIIEKFQFEYLSYQINMYLKSTFFEKNYENRDIYFHVDIGNIEDIIKQVIDEYKKYYLINVNLESSIKNEKFIITDIEKLKDFIRLIFDFSKQNDARNLTIRLSVLGPDIKTEFIFEDKIVNYIGNKTITDIQKQTLWIRISDIMSKITGNYNKREENSLILTFKKI